MNKNPIFHRQHLSTLPREIPLRTTFRTAVLIALIPVTIIFLINGLLVWQLNRNTPNQGHAIIKAQWERLEEMKQPVDWIILGDSSALQGVVPQVIETSLGGSAINLGTNAGMILMDDVWMLESYIERFGAPGSVIIVHTYDMWHRDLEAAGLAKTPLSLMAIQDLSVSPSLTPGYMSNVIASRYFPLYAENRTIVDLLINRSSANRKATVDEIRAEGYMRVDNPDPDEVYADAARHRIFVEKNVFELSMENEEALMRLIALSELHGFDTFLVNGPLYEELATDDDFQSYFSDLRETFREASRGNDHFVIIPIKPTFSADQMVNVDHVISSAAMKYTELIAREIRNIQSAAD